MRKLLEFVAVLALLNVAGIQALADGPALSAQPVVQPGTEGSTAGGSASATPGTVGPATIASSEPVTASSSNTAAPGTSSQGSTSATAPGTRATVPTSAAASQPNPSAPDGSTPATHGPAANADASRTNVTASDSRARANLVANATGSFGGSMAGVGSAEDPTNASTCSSAEAAPGVPTDVSLATACGSQPTSASEDFGANGSDGSGANGAPSGSACFIANGSAGTSPSADVSGTCSAQGTANSSGGAIGNQSANGQSSPAAPTGFASERFAASVLGIASLPSTATGPASISLLGAALVLMGVAILRKTRGSDGWSDF